jgi:hypothetical protein
MASPRPQWLLVMVVGGAPLSIELLAPGRDIRAAFLSTVSAHRTQGWSVENEPDYPCVFVHKEDERRMVTISHVDPVGASLAHSSPWKNS